MIKERVIQVLEYKNIAKENFYLKIGVTSANFRGNAKKTPLNSNTIENILSEIPDLNPQWLISGKGEMLKNNEYISIDNSKEDFKNEYIKELKKANELLNEINELRKEKESIEKENYELKEGVQLLKKENSQLKKENQTYRISSSAATKRGLEPVKKNKN